VLEGLFPAFTAMQHPLTIHFANVRVHFADLVRASSTSVDAT
jgi:hypothetical protein